MTSTSHRHETDGAGTRAPSALDELRAAYREQLNQLAAERDEARRQARRAKAQAAVARADLASLQSRVHELLTAAARHLPDLPAVEAADRPAEVAAAASRAIPAPSPEPAEIEAGAEAGTVRPAADESPAAVRAETDARRPGGDPDDTGTSRQAPQAERPSRSEAGTERRAGETVRHQTRRRSRKDRRRRVRTG
ncbi:hypothetical protein [Actinomadura verrucosospora]|uniref:Uncharacterized protein n=1 Tax=Actinomadura verrucosospora TaxID=46165 RepID=A0A7D4A647_ACTVE|nr:hypothetical protein [Actinomadura verrucosospora]QKG26144.1 hypothetical protein ACTIVE_7797 [Actinomadura verrucosospora]